MASKDFTTPLPSLAPGTTTHGFTVERTEALPEITGTAYLMRHDTTGARLMWLACDNPNKGFGIGFKTPPADDTGVFHINEHSVLCGSDRFPVKEPFVNLLKTSMQTFLNAFTFADKTFYPVSSTNDQDLENLADVYLDAVLHPAIYQRPHIFKQEGWHYEVADDDTLVRNGVVFNEMKGSLSDPDSVLVMWLNRELFPDTAYGFESGGDPKAIPNLTYEMFIDANARHYRLDNSYTILFGDIDADRMLALCDTRFSGATQRDAGDPNPLELQKPVCSLNVERTMSTTPENACVGLGYVFATAQQRCRILAADVLLDALMGSNEAPLKRVLLEAGLGSDVQASIYDGILQPFVFLQLKGAQPGVAEQLRKLVEDTCESLAEQGIGREILESSLEQMEFAMREGEWGISDSVALSIQAMAGWLYDDDMACAFLHYEDELAELRAMLDNGGFEQLMREIFLENDHMACVSLNAAETTDAADEAAELAHVAAQMGEDGLNAVRAEVEELRCEQETPDSPEDLAKLPQLHVSDVGPAPEDPQPFVDDAAPLPCIAHELDSRKINYVYHYFGLDCVSWDELPYVSLLALLLGKLGTSKRSALELDTLVQLNLGSLDFFCETYHVMGTDDAKPTFVVGASALSKKVEALATLPREVWEETQFDDRLRVAAILDQRRLELEQSMAAAGHSWSLARLSSYTSRAGLVTDQLAGVGYYLFLRELIEHFDERFDALVAKLGELSQRIFAADRAAVSFVGSAEERVRYWSHAAYLGLVATGASAQLVIPEPVVRNEAFVVPTNVCFVGQSAAAGDLVSRVSGDWLVAARALSLDYLWNEVRVKGGAYGCGFRCTNSGRLQYYSYRDPAVDPTIERFGAGADWLSAWDPSTDELEGYIVSNVATRDAPMKPRALARRQDMQRFSGITEELRQEIRNELIACTPEKVRALGGTLKAVADRTATCVFGGQAQIEASSAELEVVELLG